MELIEEAHPFVPLLIAVSQDQNGGFVAAGGGELRRCHLRTDEAQIERVNRINTAGCSVTSLSKQRETYSEYTRDVFAAGMDDVRGQDRTD